MTFRAMNTDVNVDGAPAGPVEAWFRRVEACLSRFDPDSALSQLNRMPGRWVVVPPLLFHAVAGALRSAAATGGAFDPTVLGALEAAGYSRSFEQGPTPVQPARPTGRWGEIRLEPRWPAIWLPQGVRLDLGGIGKGLAVDGALALLRDAPRAAVNAGGDLAVKTTPGDLPVPLDVEDPFDLDRVLATFWLQQGAAATSSTLGRRWGAGLHHLIDPATGRPAAAGVAAATVLADSAARAEVMAKAAVILGPKAGLALLRRHRCHGLLVLDDRSTVLTPGLEGFCHVAT